jgi:hypothetical protein
LQEKALKEQMDVLDRVEASASDAINRSGSLITYSNDLEIVSHSVYFVAANPETQCMHSIWTVEPPAVAIMLLGGCELVGGAPGAHHQPTE